MFDKTAFAKRLRELREEKGWTQKEAAEKCGIVCSTYSAYENKKNTKSPLLDVAVQIAEGYGITLNELCGMEVKPPEKKPLTRNEALSVLLQLGKDGFIMYDGENKQMAITDTQIERWIQIIAILKDKEPLLCKSMIDAAKHAFKDDGGVT